MESILAIQDEVYPLKCRRKRSSAYFTNPTNIKVNTLFSRAYQYIKTMLAQRFVYILGIFNLILAVIAIVCVTQAEDHPEYFSLVYIAISVFIFYMSTIVFIIILQIVETYQEQYRKTHSSPSSMKIPLLPLPINIQSKLVLVQNTIRRTESKTRLSRSQTLPLPSSSINSQQTLPTITSTYALKDFNPIVSTHSTLLPKYQQSCENLSKNYQSFAATTHDRSYPSYTTISNSDSSSHLASLIKPIPFTYPANSDFNKSRVKFSED